MGAAAKSLAQTGNAEPDGKSESPKSSNRRARLLILLLASCGIAAGSYSMRNHEFVNSIETRYLPPTQYQNTHRASAEIDHLLEISGIASGFSNADETLVGVHKDYFKINPGGVSISQADKNKIYELVPKAYNYSAMFNAAGNRLQDRMHADDIKELTNLYEQPIVAKYVEIVKEKNAVQDASILQDFIKAKTKTPLPAPRQEAVTELMDIMSTDDLMFSVLMDVQRNLIATATQFRSNPNSTATKTRMREEIRTMRGIMKLQESEIRNHSMLSVAWQLESMSIDELQQLGRAMDSHLNRQLMLNMTQAYETSLRNGTLWLHSQL